MVPYQYRPLNRDDEQIRIVQLHHGNHEDQIRISISNITFRPTTYVHLPDSTTVATPTVTKSMPSHWFVSRTLEGRAIYHRESKDGKIRTSWVHPDVASERIDHKESVCPGQQVTLPEFEAVSYTWGSIDTLVDIEIVAANGSPLQPPQTIKVGPNLFTMLRYLRHQHISRSLWIDAICINQKDFVERGEQVRRMNHIYAFATRVIVWLGEATEDSALALEMLEHIGKQLEYTQDGYCLPSPDCTERFWYKDEYLGNLSNEVWTAIASLTQRPYFERLWILQEIQSANHNSVVQCGQAIILWYHVRRAFLQVYKLSAGLPQFSTPLLKTKIYHLYRISNALTTLDSDKLFYMTSNCECSDPRDKIFAILGLLPRNFASSIELAYGAAAEKVYMQSYLAFIGVTHRLTLLGSLSSKKVMSTRPSWVPDFDQLEHERMISFYNFASSLTAAEVLYKAPNELHVTGVISDTVAVTGPILTDNLRLNYRLIQNLRSKLGDPSLMLNDQDFLDACSWVLTLGDLRDRWIDLDVIPSLQEMRNFIAGYEGDLAEFDLTDKYKHWYQVLMTDMGPERLFLTHQGRVGCGPTTTQPGDKLSVLLGYSHPVLLRPVMSDKAGRSYNVLGPTYVHGLMDGEGILGPLPTPWRLVVRNPSSLQTSYTAVAANPSFYNPDTGQHQKQDPRLGLPDGQWEPFETDDEARLGTCIQYYRHVASGHIINSDPDLAAEELKSRGIPLETVVLV